ncbi:MAG: VOC family protein [Caulobacterales bacterium]
MRIEALDHVNIRCPDVAATINFFSDVLGMKATLTPGMTDMSEAAWICDAEGRAVVHVGKGTLLYPFEDAAVANITQPEGSGRLHHVALRCTGFAEMERRLQDKKLTFHTNEVPQIGLRQIFVYEPNGILLELNFFAD